MLHIDDYFVIFTCALAIVMAIGLFFRPLNKRNILLAIILFLAAYIQFSSVLMVTKIIYQYSYFVAFLGAAGYALSPFVFLYVSSFTHCKGLSLKTAFHFIPVIFSFIFSVYYLSQPLSEKIKIIDGMYHEFSILTAIVLLSVIAFLTYTVIIIIKVIKIFHRENSLHVRLVKVFIFFLTWIVLLIIKVISIKTNSYILWRIVNFAFAIDILLLYFIMQKMPIILGYGNMCCEYHKQSNSNSKSILDSIDVNSLKINIELMMDEEKLYCDEDLSLKRFSQALEVSSHQLSAFLNEHFSKNFNSFINEYRINHACSLLESDSQASTLSVAFASGFNSYSAFFSAFKKSTGKSPGNYKTGFHTKK